MNSSNLSSMSAAQRMTHITNREHRLGEWEVNVCIAGGRDYTDQETANNVLSSLLDPYRPTSSHYNPPSFPYQMRKRLGPDGFIGANKEEFVGRQLKIISGRAKGADKCGFTYAYETDITVASYPAKWNIYGKIAGYLRNIEMALETDILIAFWDGKSKGTKHMIDVCKQFNIHVEIVNY